MMRNSQRNNKKFKKIQNMKFGKEGCMKKL